MPPEDEFMMEYIEALPVDDRTKGFWLDRLKLNTDMLSPGPVFTERITVQDRKYLNQIHLSSSGWNAITYRGRIRFV